MNGVTTQASLGIPPRVIGAIDCPLEPIQVTLGNAHFLVRIIAPGTDSWSRHGQRFDTLGGVAAVILRGHTFLGRPGLVDEFGILRPPGYAQVKPGEPFLKIGIGEFIRPAPTPYQCSRQYYIARWASVEMEQGENAVVFRQSFTGSNGWAYNYHKCYRVDVGQAQLDIAYELTNTGIHALDTDQYNHNFFCFAGVEVSPAYCLELGFSVAPTEMAWLQRLEHRLLEFRPAPTGSYFSSSQTAPAAQNDFWLRHTGVGQTVAVHGDYDIFRFALWANRFFISPEVFVAVRLTPGRTQRWKRIYRFQVDADGQRKKP